jgi:hypothetical protein
MKLSMTKRVLKKVLLCTFLISVFQTLTSAQNKLTIRWGLESGLRTETKATGRQNAASWPATGRNEKLYRYFKAANEYPTLSEMMRRHNDLWRDYRATLPNSQRPDKKAYLQFARTKDPYFIGLVEKLAPVLYFDFIGTSGKEYVLDSIRIRTLSFEEYSGGGFSQDEAWYDLTLPKIGERRFAVGSKLRFTASGRAKLRLFSSNYYPGVGLTPMGCYMIDIQFNFFVDNTPIAVSTGPFKIDV